MFTAGGVSFNLSPCLSCTVVFHSSRKSKTNCNNWCWRISAGRPGMWTDTFSSILRSWGVDALLNWSVSIVPLQAALCEWTGTHDSPPLGTWRATSNFFSRFPAHHDWLYNAAFKFWESSFFNLYYAGALSAQQTTVALVHSQGGPSTSCLQLQICTSFWFSGRLGMLAWTLTSTSTPVWSPGCSSRCSWSLLNCSPCNCCHRLHQAMLLLLRRHCRWSVWFHMSYSTALRSPVSEFIHTHTITVCIRSEMYSPIIFRRPPKRGGELHPTPYSYIVRSSTISDCFWVFVVLLPVWRLLH